MHSYTTLKTGRIVMALMQCTKLFLFCTALFVAVAYGCPPLLASAALDVALPNRDGVQTDIILYRPADSQKRAPLFILVTIKQPKLSESRTKSSFVTSIKTLNHHGVAVAHLGIPSGSLKNSEVAKQLSGLIQDASNLGFDAQRIYLGGMGYGARFVSRSY